MSALPVRLGRRLAPLAASAVALGALVLGGSGPAAAAVHRQPSGGTAVVTFQSDFNTLDPALSSDVYSNSVIHALFVNLLEFTSKGTLVPWAASSYHISNNGLTYTFHINKGIMFTDGEPANSYAFAYAIERVLTPATKSPGSNYYSDIVGASAFTAGKAKTVTGIQTPGPYTIVFHLVTRERVFADYLALQYGDAVPQQAVQKEGTNFASHPVGDGPFVLQTWVRGSKLVLVKNPKYFDKAQAAHLNSVVFNIGVTPEVAFLSAEKGQVDVLGDLVPPADLAQVRASPQFKSWLHLDPIPATEFIYMDEHKAPFNNLLVREAVYHAIDAARILQLVGGAGVLTGQIIPLGVPGYDKSIKPPQYDPTLAKKLLAQAHYSNANPPTFWVFTTSPGPTMAQAVQQELAQVGMKVVLKELPFSTLVSEILQPGNVQFGVIGWNSGYPDPNASISAMFETARIKAGTNLAYYDNPKTNALLVKADALPLSQAIPLYQEAQRQILANYPWVPLYNQAEANFVNPKLGGFTQDAAYWFDYANWYLK
jgi:oligopeptide transport system substrate-binding protein